MKQTREKRNHVTLVSMFLFGNFRAGRSIHAYIVDNCIELDAALGTALFEMNIKWVRVEEAFQVFSLTTEKNLQSWTMMISGLAGHGRGKDAISLFNDMQQIGLKSDSMSCSVILSACSHLGLVDEGRKYYQQMKTVFDIKPTIEHYGCMVDLLGRAGLIEEAYGIIKRMPTEPNSIILRSFIGACTNHGKVLHVDDNLRKLLLILGANYVLAANVSSLSCGWTDAT